MMAPPSATDPPPYAVVRRCEFTRKLDGLELLADDVILIEHVQPDRSWPRARFDKPLIPFAVGDDLDFHEALKDEWIEVVVQSFVFFFVTLFLFFLAFRKSVLSRACTGSIPCTLRKNKNKMGFFSSLVMKMVAHPLRSVRLG